MGGDMFDNLRSAMVGAGSRGLSALVFPGLFNEGWASRFGRRLRAGPWRVRSSWWPILQVAVAASAAWYLAALLLGHEQPFVAPIATVIALGATAGRTGRRAVEWSFGVAFGLAIADLVMFAIGTGPFQIGAVAALAMAAAIFLGAGPLLVTEAGVSALLVITLDPSTAGPSPDRLLDALVGSGVALTVHSLLPVNPRTVVEQAARPIFADLTATLEEASVALAAGDPARAEAALWRAREIDVRVTGLREALDTGYETARLSPSRRRALKRLAPYAEAAHSLDLAVRNTRVLARATVGLVRHGEPAPGCSARPSWILPGRSKISPDTSKSLVASRRRLLARGLRAASPSRPPVRLPSPSTSATTSRPACSSDRFARRPWTCSGPPACTWTRPRASSTAPYARPPAAIGNIRADSRAPPRNPRVLDDLYSRARSWRA
jgi:uncharacterized membrane protein YgaE (UPF0421/DUF939 family)